MLRFVYKLLADYSQAELFKTCIYNELVENFVGPFNRWAVSNKLASMNLKTINRQEQKIREICLKKSDLKKFLSYHVEPIEVVEQKEEDDSYRLETKQETSRIDSSFVNSSQVDKKNDFGSFDFNEDNGIFDFEGRLNREWKWSVWWV